MLKYNYNARRLLLQSQRYFATPGSNKVLTEATISDSVKEAEYAVRGAIPILGGQIQEKIN